MQFFSGEANSGVPVLRLLVASSLATGAMSVSLPGVVASTPAGRRLLGTNALSSVQDTLSSLVKAPVTVSIGSYSVYFDLTVAGLNYTTYMTQKALQTDVLNGVGLDLSEPASANVRLVVLLRAAAERSHFLFVGVVFGAVKWPASDETECTLPLAFPGLY